MTISFQAFTGDIGYQTIKVIGYHEKRLLQVLIDTGSTRNFIDQEAAKKLDCNASDRVEQSFSVAYGRQVQTTAAVCNGYYRVSPSHLTLYYFHGEMCLLLGVQRVNTLGRILIVFRSRTIEFMYQGKKHMLRGASSQLK